jgi:small-conductance mechanosensitive channel
MTPAIPDLNYVYAALTVLFGILLALIARMIVRWLKAKADTTETKLYDIIIAAIGTPVQVTIVAIAVHISLTSFGIVPPQYAWILDQRVITSFYIVMGSWILSTFLHDVIAVYGKDLAQMTESDWDDRLIELLERIVKYLVWFAGLMLILSVFEINITPFLAGAGIAGLAIALAAQDILSNFFGGAIITVDKPFRIGDRIKVENNYGDVVEIGPRSTRIKTPDNQIITMPNNKITTSIIVNYSQPDPVIKMTIPISVAYGTDVDTVKRILLEIADDAIKNTDYLLAEPKPRAFFTEFGSSDLKFILSVWARAYNTPDEVKDSINSRIAARFASEGIEIPYQQIDIRMRT